jgi:hypothetical protein
LPFFFRWFYHLLLGCDDDGPNFWAETILSFNTDIYTHTNNQGWRQRQHKLHSCLIQSLSDEINCTAVEILFLSSSTQTFFKKMNPNLFDVALLKATNNTFPNVLSVRFSISYIHRIIVEPSSINHLIGAVYGVLLCITLT